MPDKFTLVLEVTTTDYGVPKSAGGWHMGQRATVRTFNPDGTITHQPRTWRDGAWHDEGPATISGKRQPS